jgi:predicted RNA-binding protein with PUA-like domain
MRHWLMKSEPDVYSIDDLQRDGATHWDGVRNYQARNFMRDMQVGDKVLFYHSNHKPPGIAGVAVVARAAYPDHTQFDPKSDYHDPKSDPENPRWEMVDIAYESHLPRLVSITELKAEPALDGMAVVAKGSRLSVQPVEPAHFAHVLSMA